MLEHDPELHARGLRGLDQLRCPLGRALERLLQKDVLAGGGEAPDQLEVSVRRGQDHDRVDRGVARDLLQVVAKREVEALGERRRRASLRLKAEATSTRSARSSRLLACGRHRHAEADDRDASLVRHVPDCPAPKRSYTRSTERAMPA